MNVLSLAASVEVLLVEDQPAKISFIIYNVENKKYKLNNTES